MNPKGLTQEQFDEINKVLADNYGTVEYQGQKLGIFRIAWSEDEFEHRLISETPEGLSLTYPEMRRVPKYRTWIHEKYVAESLKEVPIFQQNEIRAELSYEPIWVFERTDERGNTLLPNIKVMKFLIEHVLKRMQVADAYKTYVDPEANPEQAAELKKQRVDELVNELFGNETSTGDGLAQKSGVGYTKGKENEFRSGTR